MCEDDLSYCELRSKEVVNATDGKRMGRIVDILFSRTDGTISGIVVPFARRSVFSKNQDIFIPWRCVQKIGEDVILVNLVTTATNAILSRADAEKIATNRIPIAISGAKNVCFSTALTVGRKRIDTN